MSDLNQRHTFASLAVAEERDLSCDIRVTKIKDNGMYISTPNDSSSMGITYHTPDGSIPLEVLRVQPNSHAFFVQDTRHSRLYSPLRQAPYINTVDRSKFLMLASFLAGAKATIQRAGASDHDEVSCGASDGDRRSKYIQTNGNDEALHNRERDSSSAPALEYVNHSLHYLRVPSTATSAMGKARIYPPLGSAELRLVKMSFEIR